MYLNTNYQNSGAGALVNYIERDCRLRNTVGREVSQSERERFIEKSQEHNFEREIRISPDPEADVSREELERETQRYLRDFTRDRPSARAIYAYHEDNGIPHVHAALTGERDDLYMEQQEIKRDRQRLTRTMEQGLTMERQQQRQQQRQRQRQRLELEPERERDRQRQRQERDRGLERDRELELGRSREPTQEQRREQRLAQDLEREQRLEQQIEQERELEQEREQRQRQRQEQSQSQSMSMW